MTNMFSNPGNASDLYQNLIIEVRPRLQSVNVFINLKRALKNVQIHLRNNEVIINEKNAFYTLPCKPMEILSDSLNCVRVTDENISFRFSTTKSDTFGTFKTEILQLKLDNLLTDGPTTFLNKNRNYNITCVNCSQFFQESIEFDRVLPLPSDHAEPGDWFCHNHTTNVDEKLDPKIGEVFYSTCFAHVNAHLLNGTISTSTNVICKRCMYWLGLVVNENCHKIWFNTVCFSDETNSHKTNALFDTYLTLRYILKESLLSSMRIILQCQVSNHQTDYVLLWIVEKKLNVITDLAGEGFGDRFVAKVLFKFQSGWNEDVKQWSGDMVVSNVSISKSMMVELLKHLYRMNKLLPRDCNMSNDFYISYLSLYSDE